MLVFTLPPTQKKQKKNLRELQLPFGSSHVGVGYLGKRSEGEATRKMRVCTLLIQHSQQVNGSESQILTNSETLTMIFSIAAGTFLKWHGSVWGLHTHARPITWD